MSTTPSSESSLRLCASKRRGRGSDDEQASSGSRLCLQRRERRVRWTIFFKSAQVPVGRSLLIFFFSIHTILPEPRLEPFGFVFLPLSTASYLVRNI